MTDYIIYMASGAQWLIENAESAEEALDRYYSDESDPPEPHMEIDVCDSVEHAEHLKAVGFCG